MSGKLQPSEDEIKLETERFNSKPTSLLKETEFVHDVYNEIAQHFSQTRYKPWPIVVNFLETRKPRSIGIDIGCGNGKYISVNPKLFILGSDYSTGLINQAYKLHKGENCNDLIISDGLNLPHCNSIFEFAISIAVIHHFADEIRRINAIKEILRVLKIGGQALIYCWALEQENSRRGYKDGMKQDILVPWVLVTKGKKKKDDNEIENDKVPVKMRFYHLYKKGELVENCIKAGGKIIDNGYERDNWWVIIEKI